MSSQQYQQQRRKFAAAFLALIFILAAVDTAEAGKKEKPEKKVKKSDCGEWQWSVCVPTSGDCGLGTREGTRTGAECKQTMKTQRCKIPCNWKKQFGAECKYQFQAWGECDLNTALKTRTGSLKRALHNADCQKTVTISKPCGKLTKPKPQAESKKKKGRQETGEDAGLKDATVCGPGKGHQQTGSVNYSIYTYCRLFIQQLSVA